MIHPKRVKRKKKEKEKEKKKKRGRCKSLLNDCYDISFSMLWATKRGLRFVFENFDMILASSFVGFHFCRYFKHLDQVLCIFIVTITKEL
jgi:hypothetical protein